MVRRKAKGGRRNLRVPNKTPLRLLERVVPQPARLAGNSCLPTGRGRPSRASEGVPKNLLCKFLG